MKCIKLDFTKSINHNYADDTDLTLVGGGGNYPVLVEDEGSTSLYLDLSAPYQGFEIPYEDKYDTRNSQDYYVEWKWKLPQDVLDSTYVTNNLSMQVIGSQVNSWGGSMDLVIRQSDIYCFRQYGSGFDFSIGWSGFPRDLKYHKYKIYRYKNIVYFYLDKELVGTCPSANISTLGAGYPFGIFYMYAYNGQPMKGLIKNFTLHIGDIDKLVNGDHILFNNFKVGD
jgi:hypothetical protein